MSGICLKNAETNYFQWMLNCECLINPDELLFLVEITIPNTIPNIWYKIFWYKIRYTDTNFMFIFILKSHNEWFYN